MLIQFDHSRGYFVPAYCTSTRLLLLSVNFEGGQIESFPRECQPPDNENERSG